MSETLRVLTDEELPCVAGGSLFDWPWAPYEFYQPYMTYEQYMAIYGQWHPTP